MTSLCLLIEGLTTCFLPFLSPFLTMWADFPGVGWVLLITLSEVYQSRVRNITLIVFPPFSIICRKRWVQQKTFTSPHER